VTAKAKKNGVKRRGPKGKQRLKIHEKKCGERGFAQNGSRVKKKGGRPGKKKKYPETNKKTEGEKEKGDYGGKKRPDQPKKPTEDQQKIGGGKKLEKKGERGLKKLVSWEVGTWGKKGSGSDRGKKGVSQTVERNGKQRQKPKSVHAT